MVRIAIPLIGGSQWRGGRNYMINLLQALQELGSGQVEPVLFLGDEDNLGSDLDLIDSTIVVRNGAFDLAKKQQRLTKALLTGIDGKAAHLFQQHGIDCAFETAQFFGWRFPLPVLAWMPDFQHRHMPQLFSKPAWWKRDLGFRAQVASGRHVMLSSEDARRDCELYYPQSSGRTSVVSFAAQMPRRLVPSKIVDLRGRYDLPEKYFFVPNQFWVHKNHEVVIRALAMLKARNSRVCVVATGRPDDPRAPAHFSRLQQLIAGSELQNAFRILGNVSFTEVQALMQGCVAVINPSYFEGWSTTVEEAKALGVPVILSDLRVHREQAPDNATYFDPDNYKQLANLLENYSPKKSPNISQIEPVVTKRRIAFVRAFEHAVILTSNSR